VWPIVETPVPQTDVPGERTAPTQPIPSKPPAFDVQGITTADLIDFTPELRAKAIVAVKRYRLGQLFSPPSLARSPDGTSGTLNAPGSVGGANWEHGSFDPETGILYVGSFTSPTNFALERDSVRSDMRYSGSLGRVPRIDGLPLLNPPYNRVTAIDLNRGEKLWTVAAGDTPDNIRNNPALAGLTIPRTGSAARPAVLATKTLLFVTEGWATKPVLHVHDKKTGAQIADIPVAGWISGSPMSYEVNGTQYIAVWVGRGGQPAELTVMTFR
jgi:quinoprotein glucose dehydrogenase